MPSNLEPQAWQPSIGLFNEHPTTGGVVIRNFVAQEEYETAQAAALANIPFAFAPTEATASADPGTGLIWAYRETLVRVWASHMAKSVRIIEAGVIELEPSATNYIEYDSGFVAGTPAVVVNQSGFSGGDRLALYEVVTDADSILSFTDRREWLDSNGTETVLVSDTTKPTFASASINAAGDTLTVNLTETDSPPILPATDIEGFTLGGVSGRSIGNGTRATDTSITFAIAGGVVYSGESPTVEYSPGNVIDSAETPNAMDAFGAQSVTNNSEEEEPGAPFDQTGLQLWLANGDPGSGATWNDSSPNGYDATLVNTPTWNGDGSVGFASGSSQRADLGDQTNLNIAGDAISICGWVNRASAVDTPIMARRGASMPYQFTWGANNKIIFDSDTISSRMSASTYTQTGTFHHLAMTYDGTNIKFYFDGVLTDTFAQTGNIGSNAINNYVGWDSGSAYANASITDVMVFSRALSDSDIADVIAATGPDA